MTIRNPGSARLIWVDAFVAFAAFENPNKGAPEVGRDAVTIQRQIKSLEHWLSRMLITDDNPAELSDDGHVFLNVALEILRLSNEDSLLVEMSKTRISPAGVVSVDGWRIKTPNAGKIGNLLVGNRAKPSLPCEAPPKLSPETPASDLDMGWYTPSAEIADLTDVIKETDELFAEMINLSPVLRESVGKNDHIAVQIQRRLRRNLLREARKRNSSRT